MNKEVIKAMNRKKSNFEKWSKWWSNNSYKVWRVILFPGWLCILAHDKIEANIYSRTIWDEERANNILQYYIPRYAKWRGIQNLFISLIMAMVGKFPTLKNI